MPQSLHQADVVVGARAAPLERFAQRGEFFGQPTHANAKIETTARQDIQVGRLLRGEAGVALRDHQHPGAEADVACMRRHETQQIERL